ncbi:hypothetical protein R3W88_000941 [Solanum pinnatisectum]|uniref:Late embryogenesis abundant protein LEA-2 subgroup domain-containing protein n=1 Tax=Solanum pinnatisectum TaxID=50273 RepID=A0AAV9MH47_9SOLN|nr:hypothetical protein R3W88_000941 [Solanum pinnatisectum]
MSISVSLPSSSISCKSVSSPFVASSCKSFAKWKSLGFTHIHFGAVRVALKYHGKKGQPDVARLSLQNTRYYEYHHALKIQVQILGAPLARDAIQVTLHYQLAWRVQNHAMDLSLLGGQDSLFLNIDATNGTTQCTQIPRK